MRKDTLSGKINDLFAQEKWQEARLLLSKELEKTPQSHWLLDRISVTFYEERKYNEALQWIERARELAPACPLVLWDYAGTLDALGKPQDAVDVYINLMDACEDDSTQDECGESEEWSMGLIADCFFRIGVCFRKLNSPKATMPFKTYIMLRNDYPDLPSIYSIDEALEQIKKAHKARKKLTKGETMKFRDIVKRQKQELLTA